jgi:hypothetical protein
MLQMGDKFIWAFPADPALQTKVVQQPWTKL